MLNKGNSLSQCLMRYFDVLIKTVIGLIGVSFLINCSTAYPYYSAQQIQFIIDQSIPKNELRISATKEVVITLNYILHHFSSQEEIRNAMKRMDQIKPMIEMELQNKNLPLDLMALPIVESEYNQLKYEKGTSKPAGIWQMVPETARKYGLVIKGKHDDRLNIQAQTIAIAQYLNDLYAEFHDWRLVLIAYKLGDEKTMHLMKKIGSHDPWVLVHSKHAPAGLKRYLSKINSIIIIMHNPSLIGMK